MANRNGRTLTLLQKAEALAKQDRELNGGYLNTPYTVRDGSDYYKAFVRQYTRDEQTVFKLEIVRPAIIVGTCTLEQFDENTPTDVVISGPPVG